MSTTASSSLNGSPMSITIVSVTAAGSPARSFNMTVAYPPAITASYTGGQTITVSPAVVVAETLLTGIGDNSTTSPYSTTISLPGINLSPSAPVGPIAGLGAAIGLVCVISGVFIALLLRKNRRAAAQKPVNDTAPPLAYHMEDYGKETISQEESQVELRKQLQAARAELAAVSVLAPSTIRDQSDYSRDLNLLNNGIRQVAMRANHPDLPAVKLRASLAAALGAMVFDKFDPGLEASIETQLSMIANRFSKPSSALLWKALTLQHLPLADAQVVSKDVMKRIPMIQDFDVTPLVAEAVKLARAVGVDGKGFTVKYQSDQGLALSSP